MKSAGRGKAILVVEVTNVSVHGFWLLLEGRELFLPFVTFPWFRNATIGQLVNVEAPRPDFLHWPDLDVDLHVDSILHPEDYPLVSTAPEAVRARAGRTASTHPKPHRETPRATPTTPIVAGVRERR